jgi:DNA-binding MarR family transcriptional regulator
MEKTDRYHKGKTVQSQLIRKVMKAIYTLSDEENYNIYDATDIAEYLGLEKSVVEETIALLYEAECLGECMSLEDDGIETYHLTDKAIDMVEGSEA